MNHDKVIGGEFEINIENLSGIGDKAFLNEGYLYSSGRAALYNILKFIEKSRKNIKTLYLPDYLCHSIVDTAKKTSLELVFYPLADNLVIDKIKFEELYQANAAILLINYFGLQSLRNPIAYLRNLDKNVCIIEDNVQSFFSMFEDSDADFRFTSFRKTLPVPDGGLVKSNYKMPVPEKINTFAQYKAAGGILKTFRKYDCFDDELYLKFLEIGEDGIDDNLDKKISNLTIDLFSGIDIQRVSILRKCNASQIVKGLKSMNLNPLLPYKECNVPLFIPIWLENRDIVRLKFLQNQIFCPVHWPLTDSTRSLSKTEDMAKHELSIIVDQRYSLDDMNRILEVIDSSIHGK